MKTTARVSHGWFAVAVGLSAQNAIAALAIGLLAVCVTAANAQDSRPGDPVQQSADLLSRAREAMAQNDLSGADKLIAQAEALNPQYGPVYFGDTPKKARAAWEQMRKASTASPSRSNSLFSPLSLNKKAPPSDPFAGRPVGLTPNGMPPQTAQGSQTIAPPPSAGVGGQNFETRLQASPTAGTALAGLQQAGSNPASAGVFTSGLDIPFQQTGPADRSNVMQAPHVPLYNGTQPFAQNAMPAPPTASVPPAAGENRLPPFPGNDPRAQANQFLRSARQALAVSDLRRASDLLEQAKRQPVRYEPLDDNPANVETAIRKHHEVTTIADKNSDSYRRAYARMLMEESEGLLRWGDYAVAEQLAETARRQQVNFNTFDARPEDLLKRIAAMRQGNGPARSLPPPDRSSAAGMPGPSMAARQQVADLVRQSRAALASGQLEQAEALARQANDFRIPDTSFAPQEDRPSMVLAAIGQRRRSTPSGVMPAGGFSMGPGQDRNASRAVFDPMNDPTRNVQASAKQEEGLDGVQRADFAVAPTEPAAGPPGGAAPSGAPGDSTGTMSPGYVLFQQALQAQKAQERDRAADLFRQAASYMNELDPVTAQRLKDQLQRLPAVGGNRRPARPLTPIEEAAAKQKTLTKQVAMEAGQSESKARSMRERDPKAALAILEQTRRNVEKAGLEPKDRDVVLKRVDHNILEMRQYIEQNRSRIELTEKNDHVRGDLDREARVKRETQEKLVTMVEEFNRLMDEKRFPEAEVVAKRAAELAPKELVTQQMLWHARFVRNFQNSMSTKEAKDRGFVESLGEVDRASVPFGDETNPMQFGDARRWGELTRRRGRFAGDRRRRSERELEIEKKIKQNVSIEFKNTPLNRAVEQLAKMVDVNIFLDTEGLRQEGINPDTPVNLEVRDISVRSVLHLVLRNLHLSYVVKDEVLNITSEQHRGQVYTQTYNVADLVLPIPDFVAGPRMGLAGAYHDALGSINGGNASPFGSAPTPVAVVGDRQTRQNNATINPGILAQMPTGRATPGTPNMPLGFGPGGAGGGTNADFDSLIELITTTVQPTTWDTVGGPGSIAPFPTNLSLVISQTQEVHEEIVDLLEQLRRMQDLQVTIEVRFITLNDNFFEKMGVDFDFNIKQNLANPEAAGFSAPVQVTSGGQTYDTRLRTNPNAGTAVVGLQQAGSNPASAGIFTSDLDIPFRQGSFSLATPQFGGFDAAAGASLGFAILSDIEAFFFINAAQGDRRSNVLQAPKVTLFNGQQAFISDTSQTPFVVSVVPVVGDFAAAQQPVIVVLSEGTFMTVQAVVSPDKRFVRLTIVPFFSKIGQDVKTFTFQGTETTTTDTSREGYLPSLNMFNNNKDQGTRTRNGTTVQLPTFSYVTVTTTVSVPDGGTVLLGGIKRLSEGRNEFGVPILDKIPYINRLFKNVGIGRETTSLMMMVTPRIIIQEEEEEKMGITAGP